MSSERSGDSWRWLVVSYLEPRGRVFAAEVVSWTSQGDPVVVFGSPAADDGAQLDVVPLNRVEAAFTTEDQAQAAVRRINERRNLTVVQ